MRYQFTYTNQLKETSKYTVIKPNYGVIYQTDIERVQKIIEESQDPEFLEAALEVLDSLQTFKERLEDSTEPMLETTPSHVLFLVLDKEVITPGIQPSRCNKQPKTILKDHIREQLLSSKIRMFSKQELARNSFDLGLLNDK